MRLPTALVAACLALAPPVRAAVHVTVVDPAAWGADDDSLGVAGGVVEDFEDPQLAPGLLVELAGSDGVFSGAGSGVLPAVFDPVHDDPYGDAFVPGVWDGSHVLLNTVGNVAVEYGATDFRRVRIAVPGGASRIGLSLQQLTGNDALEVDGVALGRVASFGITPTPGRNGYVIVASDDPAAPLTSVSFGGVGDAFVIDHVVFVPAGQVAAPPAAWGRVHALYR
ncbi:MAG TPA: hypothetical protein PLQ13_02365 [Candidatus Krumholzibacteria bacterium]|nr:hypothetical protein [Candidatus Krumholzibacteria bacterium]